MKYIRACLALIAAVCLAASMVITCFSATVRIPKANGQNKKNWCWATSAKIVAEHNGGSWISTDPVVLDHTDNLHSYGGTPYYGVNASGQYTADGVQRAIVVYIATDDQDTGYTNHSFGSDSNKESALIYAANNSVSVGTYGLFSSTLTNSQIDDINYDLENGDYLIGNLYKSGVKPHSVVLKDYNSSTDKYKVLDPWDCTDMYYSNAFLTSNSFPSTGVKYQLRWVQYCH